jgi:hypothetical protein
MGMLETNGYLIGMFASGAALALGIALPVWNVFLAPCAGALRPEAAAKFVLLRNFTFDPAGAVA